MVSHSPTIAGFRAAFRRPSLTFAEISWRWTTGAVATALLAFFVVESLDSLPVTDSDLLLLSTRQPALIARVIARIVGGSSNRLVLAASLASLGVAILWTLASSLGRLVTLRALLEYFRGGQDEAEPLRHGVKVLLHPDEIVTGERRSPIRALLELNFLRATVVLATLLALAGAAAFSSLISTRAKPHMGLSVLVFLIVAILVCCAGWTTNWWLSLAQVFAERDGSDAFASISSAVSLACERTGAVFAVSLWSGLAHLVALSIAGSLITVPLILIGVAPWLAIAAMVPCALVYFAVVDWLYIARLAGYLAIMEMPKRSNENTLQPVGTPRGPIDISSSIDRSESILSDMPVPEF